MLKDAALHFYHDLLGFPIIRENYRQERDDWKIDLKINESMVVYLTKRQFKREYGSQNK